MAARATRSRPRAAAGLLAPVAPRAAIGARPAHRVQHPRLGIGGFRRALGPAPIWGALRTDTGQTPRGDARDLGYDDQPDQPARPGRIRAARRRCPRWAGRARTVRSEE